MSPSPKTNAEYRTSVHDAIRKGIESIANGETPKSLVRAVADQVLALPAPPAVDFPLIHGLPDAPVIAWSDSDHRDHVAIRTGHPGNGGWTYNGRRAISSELLELIGTNKVAPLDFRMNRQESPTEYR